MNRFQSGKSTNPQIDRLYMPAMPPLGLIARLRDYRRRRRIRRRLETLLTEDDHILCDLGFARGPLRRRLNAGNSTDGDP